MIFGVRQATGEDVQYLLDIDIKCFDQPWEPFQWRLLDHCVIWIATYYGTPVATVVFMHSVTESGTPFVAICKIAVKQAFRKQGVSRLLLNTVREYAQSHSIWLTVPESLCRPDGVLGWLERVGFNAVSVSPDCFTAYGEAEDGYVFQLR